MVSAIRNFGHLDLLDHLGILVELGEVHFGGDLRVVGNDLQQVGDNLHLYTLGRLGRLLVLAGDLDDLLLDDGSLQIHLFNLALLRGVGESPDHEAKRNDQTDFEQKTPLVPEVRFG